MKRIFKYQLQIADRQEVHMPVDAKILCVQIQVGTPCLWALVDDNLPQEMEVRKIVTFGTGYKIQNSMELLYIGTYQYMNGTLIYHVFEQM